MNFEWEDGTAREERVTMEMSLNELPMMIRDRMVIINTLWLQS